MGNLINDMTRLRGEVDAARSDRGAWIQEMASTVSAMLSDFAADHKAMAKKTSKERKGYVTGLRQETAADLMGARLAWQGESPKKKTKWGKK